MFIESLSAPIEFLTISIEFNVLQFISIDFHGLPLISGGLLWVNVALWASYTKIRWVQAHKDPNITKIFLFPDTHILQDNSK